MLTTVRVHAYKNMFQNNRNLRKTATEEEERNLILSLSTSTVK